jgi:hypothetical protein
VRPFLDILRRFSASAGRFLAEAYRRTRIWLSVPVNACLAALGLVFLVSFAAWAIADRFSEAVLWFPDSKGSLRGELRQIPAKWGAESRAELVASELLLGPKTLPLRPAFDPGVRVESVLYRKGRLFLDISKAAALQDSGTLKTGLAAMERSLRAALPGLRRLTVTIGGIEPYVDGLKIEGGPAPKESGQTAKKTGK